MTTNPLLAYLQEFFQRLSTKSPKFFRVIQIVSAVATLLTGLPGLFEELGWTLPDWATILQNKTVAFCMLTALTISKLTTQSTAAAQTASGQVLKITNDEKLPFTAANEQVAKPPALPIVMDEVVTKK